MQGDVTTADSAVASPPEARRRQRSDAVRNVDALLGSARTVFAASGVDAPAKEITDPAGVGVGTLYRHFPRRSDLIIAVMQHEIDDCVQAAHDLENAANPWEAVEKWIDRFTEFIGTKRGLAAALHSGDPAYDGLPEQLLEQLVPAFQSLLDRAIDGGYARSDATAREILTTISLMSQPIPGGNPGFNPRMIRVFVDGLTRLDN